MENKTMNNFTRNTNALDFIGSYLAKEDLPEPTMLTIKEVLPEDVEGASRKKLALYFQETEKGLLLNTTNIKQLVDWFGASYSDWVGQEITLYVDPSVEFAGKKIGGIRIAPTASALANGPKRSQQAPHAFNR